MEDTEKNEMEEGRTLRRRGGREEDTEKRWRGYGE